MSSQPPLDFHGVLSESKRIISAHSRHFLALSVLFLLPLSFLTTIYTTLTHLLTHSQSFHCQILLRLPLTHHHHHPPLTQTLLLPLVFSIVTLFLSLCAVGSITYSVFQGFYGRPVKLVPAIFSLLRSFLPLFATVLASQIIQFAVCFAFGLLVFLSMKGFELWGLRIEYSSPFFIGICAVAVLCLALVLVYLQMNWALAFVVAVAESSWGFEPLRRSASLVKGMKRTALSLILFFGFFIGILVWSSSVSAQGFDDAANNGWKSGAFVVQTVVITTLVMLLMLHSFAANTVLYMYCKAIHGELAMEIADEFAREYVSLPFDDGKVPFVVSVIPA
ncbi:hypothetical protein L1049_007040 [Liquidambar formosana]|uniref:Uncharacterized protein n=1 Tax=Liquidambar formosana TaxID=63359 RepID=A0AAP0WUI1_LIQFO